MVSDRIIRYDSAFIGRLDALKAGIGAGDRRALHRLLTEAFGDLFKTHQYYARQIAEAGATDLEAADEAVRRELMRPLSWRQYRMIEQAFLATDEADIICSIWAFLDDDGRIRQKKVMSSAELGGFSLIYEQVCVCLAGADRAGWT
ncbi:MAG: hypothetical protein IJJ45_08970 [Clostridia bacterium]|nr:hypothetical protein [Clostridia bacterium]